MYRLTSIHIVAGLMAVYEVGMLDILQYSVCTRYGTKLPDPMSIVVELQGSIQSKACRKYESICQKRSLLNRSSSHGN